MKYPCAVLRTRKMGGGVSWSPVAGEARTTSESVGVAVDYNVTEYLGVRLDDDNQVFVFMDRCASRMETSATHIAELADMDELVRSEARRLLME